MSVSDWFEWPDTAPLPGQGGILSGDVLSVPEESGLGDVATRWPDLRMMPEGPKLTITPQHSRAMVPFKIPWARHYQLVGELVGWQYMDAAGFKRHLPEVYQNWRFAVEATTATTAIPNPVMYCTQAEVVGRGIDPTWATQNPDRVDALYYPDPQYDFAIVMAQFETLAYDVKLLTECPLTASRPPELQRFVTRREESGGKFLSFATGQWGLTDSDGPSPPARWRPEANYLKTQFWESYNEIRYTWFDVLPEAFNHEENKKFQGKYNDAAFDDYPEATMLLLKTNREPTRSQFGVRTYTVTFDFIQSNVPVNQAQPPGSDGVGPGPDFDPVYWYITDTGTRTDLHPRRPYRPADMRKLFMPR